MEGNKCLVTGGAGFIGSHIVDELIKENFSVIVVDNLSTGRIDNIKHLIHIKNFKFIDSNILNNQEMQDLFVSEKPDYVFHLAAQMNVRYSITNPQNDAETNILGLINILEASRKNNVKRIIFSSSGGAIYGDKVSIPTKEEEIAFPMSQYGVSKLCSEKYLLLYEKLYNLSFCSLRYANVYGPRQNPKGEAGVISIFIEKLLKKEHPVINGTGSQTRDYVYVKDAAEANILALRNELNGVFNIGTSKETSVNEIFEKIKALINPSAKAKHGPAISGEQLRSRLDYNKIKDACGWEQKYDLSSGIKETVEWFKAHNFSKSY